MKILESEVQREHAQVEGAAEIHSEATEAARGRRRLQKGSTSTDAVFLGAVSDGMRT